jgi:predicted DNA-binding transcriptional regulator YafY
MPKSKNQFLRYHIINEALRNYSWVKTNKLQSLIEDKLMEEVNPRTIQMDIKAMKEDTRLAFYAPVEYDSKKKAYRYTDRDYSINNFALKTDEIVALKFYASCLKIYSEYGIFKDFSNAIQKIVDGVSIKHSLKRETNPSLIVQTDTDLHVGGTQFLTDIVHAIDGQYNIEFVYKKYGEDGEAKRIISPYLLKEYKNRWYILGVPEGETIIKTYGLDRMATLEMAPQTKFTEVEFDHGKYFKHSFGITANDSGVEKIVLEFAAKEADYIKSLPVHTSQKIVKETRDSIRVSIEVIPCYELFEFILSKTPDVKVIAPSKLANHIELQLSKGLGKYNKK